MSSRIASALSSRAARGRSSACSRDNRYAAQSASSRLRVSKPHRRQGWPRGDVRRVRCAFRADLLHSPSQRRASANIIFFMPVSGSGGIAASIERNGHRRPTVGRHNRTLTVIPPRIYARLLLVVDLSLRTMTLCVCVRIGSFVLRAVRLRISHRYRPETMPVVSGRLLAPRLKVFPRALRRCFEFRSEPQCCAPYNGCLAPESF